MQESLPLERLHNMPHLNKHSDTTVLKLSILVLLAVLVGLVEADLTQPAVLLVSILAAIFTSVLVAIELGLF